MEFLHRFFACNSKTYSEFRNSQRLVDHLKVFQKLEPKKYNTLNINKFYHLTSSRKLLYDGPINMKIQKPVSETRYWALAEVLISFKMLKGKQI